MTNGTVSVSGDFISSSAGAVYSLEGGTLLIPSGGRGFQLQNSYTFNVYTKVEPAVFTPAIAARENSGLHNLI
jgi:hypothetical protein